MNNIIKILCSELKKGLAYVSPAMGSKTSAQQESSLLYIQTIENEVLLQIQSSTVVASITIPAVEAEEGLAVLLDFDILDKYVKNNEVTSIFELDFTDVDDSDEFSVSIGDTFLGKISTVPLDAYELQQFEEDEVIELTSVTSNSINNLIRMACPFANLKRDTHDFMEIKGTKDSLEFFTTDGSIISRFTAEESFEEDFNIVVRASALRKLKNFTLDTINLQMTDDEYFMIFKEEGIGYVAIVLHTDPPFTLDELNDTEIDENMSQFSWSTESMSTTLQSLESSAQNSEFNFKFNDNCTVEVNSTNQRNNSTTIEMPIAFTNYTEELTQYNYTTSIMLFKKLATLARKKGKVELYLGMEEQDNETFITELIAAGTLNEINYNITFGVIANE